jgi:hypothetical protein
MKYLVLMIPLALCSCASTDRKPDWLYGAGMHEDAQDRNNTKYNLMDSPDGRQDPTAGVNVRGAVY